MVMLCLARYRSMSWYFMTQSISVDPVEVLGLDGVERAAPQVQHLLDRAGPDAAALDEVAALS